MTVQLLWPCDMNLAMVFSTFRDHKARADYKGSWANDLASYGQVKIPLWASQNNGTVVESHFDGTGYGNEVIVEYPDIGIKIQLGHMDSRAVAKGCKVGAGTPLGVMGTTGNSEGVHVHFAVWKKIGGAWVNVDPLDPKNGMVMVAVLSGELQPPEPQPEPEPGPGPEFVGPALPALPKYKPSAAITKWINIRISPAPSGLDIGDIHTDDVVGVFESYTDVKGNVWFGVVQNMPAGPPVVGWAAAKYGGEVWLEPVKKQ